MTSTTTLPTSCTNRHGLGAYFLSSLWKKEEGLAARRHLHPCASYMHEAGGLFIWTYTKSESKRKKIHVAVSFRVESPFHRQAMVHTSWHPPLDFMLYILLPTGDEAISLDKRDPVDALT